MHWDALGRELDPARAGVTHLARLKAGEIVGNDLGDHGDHAVGQVDARAAVAGLLIERRAFADEVRHIGDVHAEQPVAPLDPLQRNGIVEVAGIDRVDRDDHAVGEVAAVGRDRLVEPVSLSPRVGEDHVGERPGEPELVDHRLCVDADVPGLAEHLDDHSFAVAEVGRKPHHLHDDLVVGMHPLRARVAHRYRAGEARAVDLHPAHVGLLGVGADEPRGLAGDDLDDLPGRPGPADITTVGEPHANGVA